MRRSNGLCGATHGANSAAARQMPSTRADTTATGEWRKLHATSLSHSRASARSEAGRAGRRGVGVGCRVVAIASRQRSAASACSGRGTRLAVHHRLPRRRVDVERVADLAQDRRALLRIRVRMIGEPLPRAQRHQHVHVRQRAVLERDPGVFGVRTFLERGVEQQPLELRRRRRPVPDRRDVRAPERLRAREHPGVVAAPRRSSRHGLQARARCGGRSTRACGAAHAWRRITSRSTFGSRRAAYRRRTGHPDGPTGRR